MGMSETEILTNSNTTEEDAAMYVPAEDSPLAQMIAEESARREARMRAGNNS